ncbi:complex I subunit 5 family protein [Pyrobaculum neutrophilum]|uniref:NADH dehydrogenase (Quinone) n=1 Tax=Pyrobaculum neutrophilum (strain DSM 2338 / JCM 9278 / NBRC 100436 / V24Sta) TaxID=444157 RepID=B1YCT0_PYRNV|nr:complex I subunit 5 family protein [Pyrobaculum neutrophilum]ACB39593.1 NADH dehydrogenase (quinone) [Pyrobaculum neutrophilum V24Sta]
MTILASLLLPMALSLAAYVAAKRSPYIAGYISAAALLPLLAISSAVAFGGGTVAEGAMDGFNLLSFKVTPFNGVFLLTVALVGVFVALYSPPYMEHRGHELGRDTSIFYLTYGFFLGGLAGAFAAANLITVYIFIEVALVASLFQILYYGYGDRVRISVMYLVWSHVGALLMLAGFLLLYLRGVYYVPLLSGVAPGVDQAAFLLILVGSLIKMAALGVHMWLPYVHAEAPTPLSALLSPVLVGVGGYIIAAVGMYLVPPGWERWVVYYALATAVYGGLMAYLQKDLKRLFAYSTVSQMGYMLLGVSLKNAYGYTAVALLYLSHGLGKAVLFMTAGYLIMHLHTRDLEKMGGLYGWRPELAGASVVGFLNLAGVLTIGMISEILLTVAYASYFRSNYVYYIPYALMLVVTGVYAFNTTRLVFFGPHRYEGKGPIDIALASITAVAFISVLFLLPPFSSALADNIYNTARELGLWR